MSKPLFVSAYLCCCCWFLSKISQNYQRYFLLIIYLYAGNRNIIIYIPLHTYVWIIIIIVMLCKNVNNTLEKRKKLASHSLHTHTHTTVWFHVSPFHRTLGPAKLILLWQYYYCNNCPWMVMGVADPWLTFSQHLLPSIIVIATQHMDEDAELNQLHLVRWIPVVHLGAPTWSLGLLLCIHTKHDSTTIGPPLWPMTLWPTSIYI